jgi:hypothetical protein
MNTIENDISMSTIDLNNSTFISNEDSPLQIKQKCFDLVRFLNQRKYCDYIERIFKEDNNRFITKNKDDKYFCEKLREIEEYTQKISQAIKKEIISDLLLKCRNLTLELNFEENEETLKLKNKLINFGIKPDEFNSAFTAIKSVWASKYNERAYIATSKVGISLKDIRMAVLCQKIIPAEYAYVIHTKNPSNNNSEEVFAEVCVGMGEALVGAYEGQALSFAYNKKTITFAVSFKNKEI